MWGRFFLAQKLGAGGSCLHCLMVNPPLLMSWGTSANHWFRNIDDVTAVCIALITASSLRVTFSCKCWLQTKKTKICVPTSTTPTCCASPCIVSCRQVDMRWCIIDLHLSILWCLVLQVLYLELYSPLCTLCLQRRQKRCEPWPSWSVQLYYSDYWLALPYKVQRWTSLDPWVIWFMASLSDHCQLWSTFPLRSIFSHPFNSFITASKWPYIWQNDLYDNFVTLTITTGQVSPTK